MSIQCTKQFTLKVGSSGPFAYYKADSIAGNVLIDSIAGNNATLLGSSFGASAGIIGSSVSNTNAGGGTGILTAWPTLAGQDFTVRFWFNYISALSALTNLGIASTGLYKFMMAFTGGSNIALTFYSDFGTFTGSNNLVVATTTNAWHRAVLRYDHALNQSWLTYDGNPAQNFQHVEPQNTAARTSAWAWTVQTGRFMALDEIALWKRKLSDAEVDADWNGGAGKTYP